MWSIKIKTDMSLGVAFSFVIVSSDAEHLHGMFIFWQKERMARYDRNWRA